MVRITIIHFHRRCTLSKYLSSTVKSRIYALTYKNKFLRARHVKYSPNTRIHGRAIFFICSSLVDIVGIHRQRSLRYRGAAFRRANTRRFRISESRWMENGGGRPFELARYLMYSARALDRKLKFTSDGSCERLPWINHPRCSTAAFHQLASSLAITRPANDRNPWKCISPDELYPFTHPSFSFSLLLFKKKKKEIQVRF